MKGSGFKVAVNWGRFSLSTILPIFIGMTIWLGQKGNTLSRLGVFQYYWVLIAWRDIRKKLSPIFLRRLRSNGPLSWQRKGYVAAGIVDKRHFCE
jgi:hypothetical protein